MEKLEAFFALYDRASGPAKKIAGAITDVYQRLARLKSVAATAFDGAVAGFKGLLKGARDFADSRFASVVGFAFEQLKWVALGALGAGVAIGKMAIDASNAKKQMLGALESVEGMPGAAQEALEILGDMADMAGQDDDELAKVYLSLRRLGFAKQDARDIIAGSLDVKALGGDADAMLALFEKMQAGGKFDVGDKALAKIGITEEWLAETLGRYEEFKGKSQAEILDAMKDGKVAADVGMKAILETIDAKLNHGAGLGSNAKKILGDSLPGSWQRLKNAFGNLIEDTDFSPLIGALNLLGETLKGPVGQQVMESIAGGFAMLLGAIGEIATPGNIKQFVGFMGRLIDVAIAVGKSLGSGFLKGLLGLLAPLKDVIMLSDGSHHGFARLQKGIESIGKVVGAFIAILVYGVGAIGFLAAGISWIATVVIEGLGAAIGWVVDNWKLLGAILVAPFLIIGATFAAIGPAIIGALAAVWESIAAFFAGLWAKIVAFGATFVSSLVLGITGAAGSVGPAVKGVGDAAVAAMKGALKIGSPSKVGVELGGYFSEGFAIGVAGNDNAQAAAAAAVDPASLGGAIDGSSVSGASRGGRGDVTINVALAATPGMSADEARAQGNAIGEGIRAALVDELEAAAAAVGW